LLRCLEPGPLPSTGITRLHRYNTDPSATLRGPACPSRESGWPVRCSSHRTRLPVLRRSLYACVPPPLPRWNR
jgi:hypothetical protein